MTRPLILLAVLAWIATLCAGSRLFQTDAITAVLALFLLVLCIAPGMLWFLHQRTHIPLFEVYAAMHFIYYWQPAGARSSALLSLSQQDRVTALGAVCVYLAAGLLIYLLLLNHTRHSMRQRSGFLATPVNLMTNPRFGFSLLMVWLVYSALLHYGVLATYVPGVLFPYVRGIGTVSGMIGILVSGMQSAGGRLSPPMRFFYFVAVVIGGTLTFASGYLGAGAIIIGHAFFAHVAVSRRVPIVAVTVTFIALTFLNYGKPAMRREFWGEGKSDRNLVNIYTFWVGASWESITSDRTTPTGGTSILQRASLISVYSSLIRQCPANIPFYNGETYVKSLNLFVPRIFWPERPHLHSVMTLIGLRFGFHVSEEAAQNTNISVGQVGEAWINGGWISVAIVGAFFGIFFFLGVRCAYKQKLDSIGFLLGMTFFGSAANVEHLTGTLLMSFYQTALVALALLYLCSRKWWSSSPAPWRAGSTPVRRPTYVER